jgi:hypothetical protein
VVWVGDQGERELEENLEEREREITQSFVTHPVEQCTF